MKIRILCLSILFLTILGCKREESNPEIRDPIYNDIISEKRVLEQMKEDTLKKIETGEKELAKTAPRTMERKNATNDLLKEKMKLTRVIELIEYFDIRSKERYVEARREYKEAFDKNLDWPDPSEFAAYKVNKRLLHASKNWGDRVPRSNIQQAQLDNPNPTPEEETSKKSGEDTNKKSGDDKKE